MLVSVCLFALAIEADYPAYCRLSTAIFERLVVLRLVLKQLIPAPGIMCDRHGAFYLRLEPLDCGLKLRRLGGR
jgi:hypothetical protein